MSTKIFKRWIAIGILCLMSMFTIACNSETQSNQPLANDGTHQEAKQRFKENCVSCHGTDLRGRSSKNSNIASIGSRLNESEIAHIITQGNGLMPAFEDKLSQDEISQLAAWLSTLN